MTQDEKDAWVARCKSQCGEMLQAVEDVLASPDTVDSDRSNFENYRDQLKAMLADVKDGEGE